MTSSFGAPIVVLVGNPKPGSRTSKAGLHFADRLRLGLGDAGRVFDAPLLVDVGELDELSGPAKREAIDAAFDDVRRSGLLLVATPTFRAGYSGLLKTFLDYAPRRGLEGLLTLIMTTAGKPNHRGLVEAPLRLVLVEMGAILPTPGLAVTEDEFDRLDEVFDRWWERHAAVLAAVSASVVDASPATLSITLDESPNPSILGRSDVAERR